MSDLSGKRVLLTGASRGIGFVMAQALAQEGAIIIGVSRNQTDLETLCDHIQAQGGEAMSFPCDVSQVGELSHLVQQVQERFGPIDILINNAGIEIYRAFQDYALEEMQSVLSTNLLAAMELTRQVLPGMLSRNSGHIVNMASLAAKKGHPFDSIYSASKSGLLMWADALRQELTGKPVYITTICPGYISDLGMLADTHIPAPKLSGQSTSQAVVSATIKAIKKNRAEVMINQDRVTEIATKAVLAISQFLPDFGDAFVRFLQVPGCNQRRIKPVESSPKPPSKLVE